MLEVASCKSRGDIFTMTMDNIELKGNISALFVSKHPEVHHKAGECFTKFSPIFLCKLTRDCTSSAHNELNNMGDSISQTESE